MPLSFVLKTRNALSSHTHDMRRADNGCGPRRLLLAVSRFRPPSEVHSSSLLPAAFSAPSALFRVNTGVLLFVKGLVRLCIIYHSPAHMSSTKKWKYNQKTIARHSACGAVSASIAASFSPTGESPEWAGQTNTSCRRMPLSAQGRWTRPKRSSRSSGSGTDQA